MMGGGSNACLQKFYLCGQTLERGHAANILTGGMVTDKTTSSHLRAKKYKYQQMVYVANIRPIRVEAFKC